MQRRTGSKLTTSILARCLSVFLLSSFSSSGFAVCGGSVGVDPNAPSFSQAFKDKYGTIGTFKVLKVEEGDDDADAQVEQGQYSEILYLAPVSVLKGDSTHDHIHYFQTAGKFSKQFPFKTGDEFFFLFPISKTNVTADRPCQPLVYFEVKAAALMIKKLKSLDSDSTRKKY